MYLVSFVCDPLSLRDSQWTTLVLGTCLIVVSEHSKSEMVWLTESANSALQSGH